MIRIFKHLRSRERLMVAASLVFVIMQVWFDLQLPDYLTRISSYVIEPGGTMADIWRAGGSMLLCALGSVAMSIVVSFFASKVAARFSQNLRDTLFTRVGSFSMEEINSFSTASLITRSTNDITQIQMFVAFGMQVVMMAPIMAVWAITKISSKSAQWTALTGGAVVVLLVMIVSVMSYALPRFKKIQSLTDNLNRVTRENLTGIRVVRAYNAEDYEKAKFEAANTDITDNNLQAMRAMSVFNPTMRLIMSGLTLGIYWVGAHLIDGAGLAEKGGLFANMVAFSSYAMMVIMSFMMLTMIFIMLPRVAVSARRILEVLDTQPKIHDGAVVSSPEGVRGQVEFVNVGFKYPDAEEYVLQDISFTVGKGETVAFIGSTGSGKSTLINLVPRFYDVTEGQVLVDGVDVRDYTQEALRNKLSYVPQRAVLFAGTVGSNVTFGDNGREPGPEEDILRAVEIAQGADFVADMDGGLNAHVAQGGANVSGGQKQRLAIARAVYRKPEIYIFDDSFSALDYKTDKALREALARETAGVTSLIVAQRIGTIRDADKIIVLEDGQLAGMGTHTQLMETCEVYRQIAYSQLSGEELGS